MFAGPAIRPGLSFPRKLMRLNWPFLALIGLLAAVGVVSLYSVEGAADPYARQHATRFLTGLGCLFAAALVDIRWLYRLAWPAYAVSLALLVAVAFVGVSGGGARSWLDLGPLTFQPSEAMKIALILALAHYYQSVPPERVSQPLLVAAPMAMVAAPVALIALQPDLGSAAVMAAIGLGVIFLAGVSWVWFVAGIVVLWGALPFAWEYLHDYQKERLLIFVDPARDPAGAGYHITQSKIALGSGGLEGRGYMQSTQARLDFLPEKHTDFIFTMFAEEHGFIGAAALVAVYAVLLVFIAFMALRCVSPFGRLLAAGVGLTLFVYVFVNIGMVMGLLPVVGLPLPLVSFGGSAMITIMVALGLVLNAHIHRGETFDRRRR
jgi:rod shape determining protein RodA